MINQSGRLERKECEDGYCNETQLNGKRHQRGTSVIGDKRKLSDVPLELMNGVEKLIPIVESYNSVIDVGGVKSPCAVESREQIMAAAQAVKKAGAQFFQGLEEEGLKLLKF